MPKQSFCATPYRSGLVGQKWAHFSLQRCLASMDYSLMDLRCFIRALRYKGHERFNAHVYGEVAGTKRNVERQSPQLQPHLACPYKYGNEHKDYNYGGKKVILLC